MNKMVLSIIIYGFLSVSFTAIAQNTGHRGPYRLDLAGVWHSPEWGTVVLEHKGRRISGTYEHNQGQLDGVLTGDKVTFKWWEGVETGKPYGLARANQRGEGTCTISEDSKSFTGMWKYEGSSGWNGGLSAVKGVDVTGTWDSPEFGSIRIKQDGETITGSYEKNDGQITGQIDGWQISYAWWVNAGTFEEAAQDDRGEGYFTVSADGKTLNGAWRYELSSPWDGTWSARKR
jgi:hypothetical protein